MTGLPPKNILCVIAEDIPSHSNEVYCLPVIMLFLEDHLLHFKYVKVCYHLLHQTNQCLCLTCCNCGLKGSFSCKVQDILFCCAINERYSFISNFRRLISMLLNSFDLFGNKLLTTTTTSEIYFLLTQPEAHCKIFASGE